MYRLVRCTQRIQYAALPFAVCSGSMLLQNQAIMIEFAYGGTDNSNVEANFCSKSNLRWSGCVTVHRSAAIPNAEPVERGD